MSKREGTSCKSRACPFFSQRPGSQGPILELKTTEKCQYISSGYNRRIISSSQEVLGCELIGREVKKIVVVPDFRRAVRDLKIALAASQQNFGLRVDFDPKPLVDLPA